MPSLIAFSSPAWGPAPVTTVPRTIAIPQKMRRTHLRRAVIAPNPPASGLLEPSIAARTRWLRTTALVMSTMETRKCSMFEYGFRPVRTTTPPITICASTPATSPHESKVRFRIRGLSKSDIPTAAMTAIVTTPVKRRLICSIAACVEETSTNLDELHAGQSTHPSPEPVRRTSDPLTMIT
ncbi:unannotated protein [freshwater metagenome]|uniref:Unannotated protein n=1 Tax=freshwater metagenome TaxID=449393 RepID=A0A6J6U7U4_9ZZZZ